MFTAIALAAALSAPPEEEQRGDCIRPKVEQIKHRSKPVIAKHRPQRLFKTEPKEETDDCESIIAPFTASLDRASTEFSPVPGLEFYRDVPLPEPVLVPEVQAESCGCFGSSTSYSDAGYLSVLWAGNYSAAVVVPLAPVPEPEPFWLLSLGGGGGVLMFIKSRASARGQRRLSNTET